jgi:hypothetical protein
MYDWGETGEGTNEEKEREKKENKDADDDETKTKKVLLSLFSPLIPFGFLYGGGEREKRQRQAALALFPPIFCSNKKPPSF